jgi:glycerol kinase
MSTSSQLILALDQGTTSSRALIFDDLGNIRSKAQKEFKQYFPNNGWVEHDPEEIFESQYSVALEAMSLLKDPKLVKAIGITNQRETTVVWEKNTGKPIYKAIVWQDRRTASICSQLLSQGYADVIQQKTGLIIDAYFSATKIAWILDQVEGARERAENGELLFGTIDSWLIFKLTGGVSHTTDVTNASRTMLFNIKTMEWDYELCDIFNVPIKMLPEVKTCNSNFGLAKIGNYSIPIAGVAGDQQAALFGQLCTEKGEGKNTYGTGCFMVINTGEDIIYSRHNLLSTIGYQLSGEKVQYALEGSVFVGGAVIQWLRDGLKLMDKASDSLAIAKTVEDNGGIYFVPALTGLGAPHWDQYARGLIIGITRATTDAHIVRAALESIAFQVNDLLVAISLDLNADIKILKVDGGATENDLLMQSQSNISNVKVVRPSNLETTALGAAFLAGLNVGIWKNVDELKKVWSVNAEFLPKDTEKWAHNKLMWKKAVERAKLWIEE